MDWTLILGRARPIEQDALRLLTLVHQLGTPPLETEFRAVLVGEELLLALDHLVRHPGILAFVLIDQLGQRPAPEPRQNNLIRRVGDLLGQRETAMERVRGLQTGAWERWDDALAFLSCRGLLRVRPQVLEGRRPELSYWLPETTAQELEEVIYLAEPTLLPIRERCRLLAEGLLKEGVTTSPDAMRLPDLGALAARIEAFHHSEQIDPEDDTLKRLFHSTFGVAP
jgi:hypothetical protein